MTISSNDLLRERGGIALRDYTQPDAARRLKRRFRKGVPGSLFSIKFDKVARGLVLAGLGLGLAEVIAPKRVQKLVGVRRGDHSGLIRALGIREILSALLIFVQGRPSQGVWSRVLGDAMDLGLLGAAFTLPRTEKDRTTAATAAIAGLTALDVLTAAQLSQTRVEERRYSVVTQQDLDGHTGQGGFRASRTITINAPAEKIYAFWRSFENLPVFMDHLETVRELGPRRSLWVAKAPAGARVQWEAEITDDRPNERIAWRSLPDSDVPNSGHARFDPAPAGRGTVVRVELEYRPPAGPLGKTVALLFGEEPGQQVAGDLRRLKQVIETGEVIRSDASPQGYGQKLQLPAQPHREGAGQ